MVWTCNVSVGRSHLSKKPKSGQNFQVILIALVAVIIYVLFSVVRPSGTRVEEKLVPAPRPSPIKILNNVSIDPEPAKDEPGAAVSDRPIPKGLEGLPPDLLHQLQAEHDALPKHLERQLNQKPEPIPEDIKAALTAEPRIVTEDEVNSPR